MTKDEVRAEHERALARLDEEQLAALKRINRAFMESRFGNRSAGEMMEQVFEQEARERSEAEGN